MSIKQITAVLALSMVFAVPGIAAQGTESRNADFARAAIEQVYQPGFERFSQASE